MKYIIEKIRTDKSMVPIYLFSDGKNESWKECPVEVARRFDLKTAKNWKRVIEGNGNTTKVVIVPYRG